MNTRSRQKVLAVDIRISNILLGYNLKMVNDFGKMPSLKDRRYFLGDCYDEHCIEWNPVKSLINKYWYVYDEWHKRNYRLGRPKSKKARKQYYRNGYNYLKRHRLRRNRRLRD